MVYQYMYSPDGSMHGFVNHTLSYFNVSHFQRGKETMDPLHLGYPVEICRWEINLTIIHNCQFYNKIVNCQKNVFKQTKKRSALIQNVLLCIINQVRPMLRDSVSCQSDCLLWGCEDNHLGWNFLQLLFSECCNVLVLKILCSHEQLQPDPFIGTRLYNMNH